MTSLPPPASEAGLAKRKRAFLGPGARCGHCAPCLNPRLKRACLALGDDSAKPPSALDLPDVEPVPRGVPFSLPTGRERPRKWACQWCVHAR